MFKKFVNWFQSIFWNQNLQLSVLGLQNAGKSTFINVLTGNEFSEDTIPTIGFNERHINKGRVHFQLWDLGGDQKFRNMWERFSRDVDCIIFVVDSADFRQLDNSKAELHRLLAWPSLKNTTLLVLGNKNDLEGALSEEELINALDLQSIKGRDVACYSVSSKRQTNIDTVLNYLSSLRNKRKGKA
jgi:small GTP-binding protein